MLTAPLLALASAVIWGSGDFLSRKPSTKIGSMTTSVLIQPIGLLVILVILIVSGVHQDFASALHKPEYLAINLASGVIAFLGITFLYRGYLEGVMSIVAPIGGAYPVVAVTLSIILLGSILTPTRSLSIALVIIGIVLSGVQVSSLRNAESDHSSRDRLVKGADYALGAFVCAGFGLFGLGVVAPVIGSILAVVILKISQTITASLAVASRRIKIVRPDLGTFALVAIVGVCDAAGFVTYNLAITSAAADLPIVVTLSSLLGVITVILARIFYRERLEPIQIIGVVIIFVSVAAILYF
jgi:uncharacterized membrane protein